MVHINRVGTLQYVFFYNEVLYIYNFYAMMSKAELVKHKQSLTNTSYYEETVTCNSFIISLHHAHTLAH